MAPSKKRRVRARRHALGDVTEPVIIKVKPFEINRDVEIHHIQAFYGESLASRVKVGQLRLRHFDLDGMAEVTHIEVDPLARRAQVATRLYAAAAKMACEKYDAPLASDTYRTAASDAFWQKQVRKGRATCLAASDHTQYPKSDDEPTFGRSGCKRYILSCPAPATLTARSRRRR